MDMVLVRSAMVGLLLAGISSPGAAQVDACRDEVDRLASAFVPGEGGGQEASDVAPVGSLSGPLGEQPGARKGAGMGEEQRDRLQRVIDEARSAADRGDEAGCIRNLSEARALAREAGIGSTAPGSPGGGADQGGTTPGVAETPTSRPGGVTGEMPTGADGLDSTGGTTGSGAAGGSATGGSGDGSSGP